METEMLATQGTIGVLVVIIVEILKAFLLPTKWLQVASVLIGGVLGAAYSLYLPSDPILGMISGFMSGAAATGIYGAAKNPTKSDD